MASCYSLRMGTDYTRSLAGAPSLQQHPWVTLQQAKLHMVLAHMC